MTGLALSLPLPSRARVTFRGSVRSLPRLASPPRCGLPPNARAPPIHVRGSPKAALTPRPFTAKHPAEHVASFHSSIVFALSSGRSPRARLSASLPLSSRPCLPEFGPPVLKHHPPHSPPPLLALLLGPMAPSRSCCSALLRQCHVSGTHALASMGYFYSTASDILRGPLTLSRVHSIVRRNYFPAAAKSPAASLGQLEPGRNGSTSASGQQGPGAAAADGPWLIVGLGNPGPKYEGTRHNVGFELLDILAAAEGISLGSMQCKAAVGKGRICGTPVVLAKPQTFMNLSGESVGPLAKFYKVPPARVLVVYDDLDLDVAAMKLLAKGGHGGHNGMRSIIDRFGGDKNFPRLRFGIGRPPGKMEARDYVLRRFTRDEQEEVDIAIARAVDGIRSVLSQGLDRTVSQWNQSKKQTARAL